MHVNLGGKTKIETWRKQKLKPAEKLKNLEGIENWALGDHI